MKHWNVLVPLTFLAALPGLRAQAPAAAAEAARAVGVETRRIEDQAQEDAGASSSAPAAARQALQAAVAGPDRGVSVGSTEAPPPAAVPLPGVGEFAFQTAEFQGDAALLDRTGLRGPLVRDLTSGRLTAAQLRQALDSVNKGLVDQGYFIASVRNSPPVQPEDSTIVLVVDKGRVGDIRFHAMPESKGMRGKTRDLPAEQKQPFPGRYFSEAQLRRKVEAAARPGESFNYLDFRRAVLEINSSPDTVMDTDLKVRREFDPDVRSFVDLDFYVQERLPVHVAAEINNTGTRETEDYRLFLTAQHVNLTQRDDVLTISAPFSFPDLSVLQSVSLGYNLPYHAGKGGAVSVFAGYSELNADEIVENLGLIGTGYFGGLRGFHRLIDTRASLLNLTLGGVYRYTDDAFVFDTEEATEKREVEVLPVSVGLVYSAKEPDGWGGRNFATALTIYNLGDPLGVSEELNFNNQRLGAEPDYFIQKLQLARIQPVLGRRDPRNPEAQKTSQSYLFLRLDGQIASGALVSSEQLAAGGLDTVRGYPERDVAGDHGVIASLEFRTPIYSGWLEHLLPGETAIQDKVQFVAFVDGAQLQREQEEGEGGEDQFTLLSAGLGFRYSITQYTQIRLDYGYPFESTDTPAFERDVDGSGRLHFSAQAQF
jgi:hemolysin activation/secretion protein